MKISYALWTSALIMLAACNANNGAAPTSFEELLRGTHASKCIPAGEVDDFAVSRQSEIFIWGDFLRIQEKLYTNDDKCSSQPESPAVFETTVKFKELDSAALPQGFHELSISEYRVTVWAGPLSRAFAQAKYCGRDDWMTVVSANADITECQRNQYGENSRDKRRWFIDVGVTDSVRLGFLKGSKFNSDNIEWLEPGDFQK